MSPTAIGTASLVASQWPASAARPAASGTADTGQSGTSTGETKADNTAAQTRDDAGAASPTATNSPSGEPLSVAEARVLAQLQRRDDEVRAHEMAHLSASGGLAVGGASFSYQTGPDGKRYAVGGEVNIDTSPGRTPEETLQKAEQIRAAALAPAEPSAQDRKVAAEASRMAAQARLELATAGRAGQAEGSSGKALALVRLVGGVQPSATAGSSIDTYV